MTKTSKQRRTNWTQDPDAVRRNLLEVATLAFTKGGFAGARVDEIAQASHTSKRMIYYYFGDKKGLYEAVLRHAYERLNAAEAALSLNAENPCEALSQWVGFSFDYHKNNPEYVRLIAIENIHDAMHLKALNNIETLNRPAIQTLHRICQQGAATGVFKTDIDPVALHWMITSSCVFNVTNRATFSHLHGAALFEDKGQSQLKSILIKAVLSVVKRIN